MAPKSGADDGVGLIEGKQDQISAVPQIYENGKIPEKEVYKRRIVWFNVAWYLLLHIGALYGLYLAMAKAKWPTVIWAYLLYVMGGLGITAGAHRLWSHRSYKANAPLRFILMVFNCVALQNHVIEWSRDHRVHHKYSETDADPHNATRGLFFSHMGWLLVRKHPDVLRKGKQIDLSDLYQDKILVFQKKFYFPLAIFFCFVVPTIVPMYFWGEGFWIAYFTAGLFRYTWILHCTWAINSIAHMFGNRPYDKHINPRQNIMASLMALGEGWHNYHHVFPFDYRASEFPYTLNISTAFIDFFAAIGWAYDRKVVSKETIDKKKLRSGELSHVHHHSHDEAKEKDFISQDSE